MRKWSQFKCASGVALKKAQFITFTTLFETCLHARGTQHLAGKTGAKLNATPLAKHESDHYIHRCWRQFGKHVKKDQPVPTPTEVSWQHYRSKAYVCTYPLHAYKPRRWLGAPRQITRLASLSLRIQGSGVTYPRVSACFRGK